MMAKKRRKALKPIYRLTIDGGFKDFESVKELFIHLSKNWKDNTYLAKIQKIYGPGCCGFKIEGYIDDDLKALRETTR